MASIVQILWLASLLLCLHGLQATSRALNDEPAPMVELHEQWMAQYGRAYSDAAEKELRSKIFTDNVERIQTLNSEGKKSYKLGINAFADMTNDEFRASRNGLKHSKTPASGTTTFKYENVTALPSSMDWRKKGAVTPIKDQGQCGSCWAFSAVAATEGTVKLAMGELVSLSEQELVDCDTKGHNQGCSGGYFEHAFEFIRKNGGLATESKYPYTGSDDTCNAKKKAASHATKITGHEVVPANNEKALLKAVAKQPVSVTIDAGGSDFQFYSSGVFTGECGTDLDHAVAAVGYGTAGDGTKYWLVKNSWGASWGEDGYIRMEREVGAKEGLCGIAMVASYPIA